MLAHIFWLILGRTGNVCCSRQSLAQRLPLIAQFCSLPAFFEILQEKGAFYTVALTQFCIAVIFGGILGGKLKNRLHFII